jgi:hypothetical protein
VFWSVGFLEKRTSSSSHQVEDSKGIAKKPHHDLTSGHKKYQEEKSKGALPGSFWLSPYFLQHP